MSSITPVALAPAKRHFVVRGVVEGFYGTPWTHEARLEVISFLSARGMNAYVYAPKDDPKHRADWRVPYDPSELGQLGELAAHADAHGVRLGFAISPGLDITYESPGDRALVLAKLGPLHEVGVTWFLLLVDDIPMQPGIAARQAALATGLLDALRADDANVALTVCPTEYVGTRPSPYLSDLSAGLPDDVDLMWTGPTVCSPRITVDDARGWAKATGGHRIVVWDNYPVNDALMTNSLHLGPYRGRDADLVDVVGGVLCNPMTQARASLVALATAMDFLLAPDGYDPDAVWARAIDDVGDRRAVPLGVLARACADGPVARPETLALAQQVAALGAHLDGPDWPAAVGAVADELRGARALPDAFGGEDGADELAAEVAPWAAAARVEAQAGLAALRLIQQVRPVVTRSAGAGRGPDPEAAMHHAFVVLYAWSAARADEKVVYGPRFALYTPVIQLADGSPAVDAAEAVREDQNAIDALCRLALRTYDEWRLQGAGAEVRVAGDVVSQGPWSTRMTAATQLPFHDARTEGS